MTVFEQHILFNQRYQEIASNKRDTLFPEEIDILLNAAQQRLIDEIINQKFYDSQLEATAIGPLVEYNKPLDAIIPDSSFQFYESNTVYSVLPANLRNVINIKTELLTSTVNCDTAPTLATTTISEWMAVVPFPGEGSSPYYSNLTSTRTGPVTLYTAPSPYSSGFAETDSKFLLINSIMDSFNKTETIGGQTIKVYWEKYRGVYYQDSFIFVSPSNQGTITIAVDGSSSAVAMSQSVYNVYDRSLISGLTNVQQTVVFAKSGELDFIPKMQTINSYYSSSTEEIIVGQLNDFVVGYTEDSFIITRMYVDYIRKPRHINLALNQSCELSSSVHRNVVDLAVEMARLDTGDNKWQATVQDVENRDKV